MTTRAFYAYPVEPAHVAATIENALSRISERFGAPPIESWKETEIAGRFIADQILAKIGAAPLLFADITQLNFNVVYEVGFALAKGKRVVLTRHRATAATVPALQDVGIFDTLGYEEYENAEQLIAILMTARELTPSIHSTHALNRVTPVYLMQARFRTDPITRIVSRVKKARLFFRSFDPTETPRLSVSEAVENVAQSYGVLLHLLPERISDAAVHNIQAAFLAGLAEGYEKIHLLLQDGDEPVPLDYRELVHVIKHPTHIDEAIAGFATSVTAALQEEVKYDIAPNTLLEKLTFGASAAENEYRDLAQYYLETDQFKRALHGDVRLVVGRKGSGKTAIFMQVRDKVRRERTNVVLDLRPDGFQLIKFKEAVLKFLGPGALEHTITAFWEYLLLLEICHKLLDDDRIAHTRDRSLYEPYRKLADTYEEDRYVREGDFSERLGGLLQSFTDAYRLKFKSEPPDTLTQEQITELLYRHDVVGLTENVVEYLRFKRELWLLFDNIDKGWPTHGLTPQDLAIVRALLEATRKVERQVRRRNVNCHTLVFLRNDVFELLMNETPDRGKEGRVALDWSDPDLLRELLRRRLIYSGGLPDGDFYELWRHVFVSHIDGEESSQYLIDRCLMRPRALIDIANHCRAFAINLRHKNIEADDIQKAVQAYSSDLVVDIGYEIRDVLPTAEHVLYAFINEPQVLSTGEVVRILGTAGIEPAEVPNIIETMLWYGLLGVNRPDGSVVHIYDVNYDMPILRGMIRKFDAQGISYRVNPAFISGLQMRQAES
ncbi:MAG TPA: hypothetical protein VGQ36_15005 [Thermoanaerobaculia bacterium]|jgi:nucleoside 2-deoxyribosyltransferase|nr:hypothetical protein [Thermoanaerobaculia bacterium]